MFELKFTINEIEQLIKQGDAEFMDSNKELVSIYQNLYRKDGELYYNVEQRLKIQDKEKNLNKKW
ncbi:hypothetical protein KAT80_01075 [Candidatus Pacearchaeota archaeon]|nr:hypothetical protein [Candidatus Pacearchaeota archaeon]